MIRSDTLEEKAAFDRFSDLMAKLMVKHGPSVLKRRKERLIEAIRSSVDISPGIPPEEVSRLLEYYIRMEGLIKDKTAEVQEGPSESEDA